MEEKLQQVLPNQRNDGADKLNQQYAAGQSKNDEFCRRQIIPEQATLLWLCEDVDADVCCDKEENDKHRMTKIPKRAAKIRNRRYLTHHGMTAFAI